MILHGLTLLVIRRREEEDEIEPDAAHQRGQRAE